MEELKAYYLMDHNLTRLELIEIYESMIWTHRYWEAGDFELYLPATEKSMNMYTDAAKQNYYILRDEDDLPATEKSVMIISKVVSETDVEGGDHLSITGRSLKSLLSKRVVTENYILAGDLESEIRRLVLENAVEPEDSARAIPNLELGEVSGLTEFINYNAKGMQLDTVISTVCKLHKWGWDIVYDMEAKKFKFKLYKGVDRSYAQSQLIDRSERRPYVVFSDEFENLRSTKYSVDAMSYKNFAYVHGEVREYDKDKKEYVTTDLTQKVTPENTGSTLENPRGLERNEIYVEGNTSSQEAQAYKGVYAAALRTKGKTELEKYKSTTDITGKVIPNYTFEINKDYFLGDLITVQNSYGQSFDARVTEVIYTEEPSGISTIPSFVVENFAGKEEDDIPIDPDKVRYTTDHKARYISNGSVRVVGYGRKPFVDPDTGLNNPESDRDCYIMSEGSRIRVKRTTTSGALRKVSIINKPKKKTT